MTDRLAFVGLDAFTSRVSLELDRNVLFDRSIICAVDFSDMLKFRGMTGDDNLLWVDMLASSAQRDFMRACRFTEITMAEACFRLNGVTPTPARDSECDVALGKIRSAILAVEKLQSHTQAQQHQIFCAKHALSEAVEHVAKFMVMK